MRACCSQQPHMAATLAAVLVLIVYGSVAKRVPEEFAQLAPEEDPFSKALPQQLILDTEIGVQHCKWQMDVLGPRSRALKQVTISAYTRFHVHDSVVQIRGFLSATTLDAEAEVFGDLSAPWKAQSMTLWWGIGSLDEKDLQQRISPAQHTSVSVFDESAAPRQRMRKQYRRLHSETLSIQNYEHESPEQPLSDSSHAGEAVFPVPFTMRVGIFAHGNRAKTHPYSASVKLSGQSTIFTLLLAGSQSPSCRFDIQTQVNLLDYRGLQTHQVRPVDDDMPSYKPIILMQPPFSITVDDVALTIVRLMHHYIAIGFHMAMVYLREERMHKQLLEYPAVAELMKQRRLWFILKTTFPAPHKKYPAEFQRQCYSHAFLAFTGLRVWLFAIDADEYFVIQPPREHNVPLKDTMRYAIANCTTRHNWGQQHVKRLNVACSNCTGKDRELDHWPSLDAKPYHNPLELYDLMGGGVRGKSIVNPNCITHVYVHEATADRQLMACRGRKSHINCMYLAHFQLLWRKRPPGSPLSYTTQLTGLVEQLNKQKEEEGEGEDLTSSVS